MPSVFTLHAFIRIGQETLMEENLPDEDVEIELAPIAVQLAYLHQVTLLIKCMFFIFFKP